MTIVIDALAPACATEPDLFRHGDLHDPRFAALRAQAHRQCAACPLMVDCLYRAVVEVDVSGFVACTTEEERGRIRAELGIEQELSPAPIGSLPPAGGPISPEAVASLRQAHPRDTCLQLAERLGCSTSTVKRHLQRARQAQTTPARPEAARPPAPSVDDVLDAFDRLESSTLA